MAGPKYAYAGGRQPDAAPMVRLPKFDYVIGGGLQCYCHGSEAPPFIPVAEQMVVSPTVPVLAIFPMLRKK